MSDHGSESTQAGPGNVLGLIGVLFVLTCGSDTVNMWQATGISNWRLTISGLAAFVAAPGVESWRVPNWRYLVGICKDVGTRK